MLARPQLLAVDTWWGLSSHPTRGQSVPKGAVGAVGWHPTGVWGAQGHQIAYFGLGVAAAGAGVAAPLGPQPFGMALSTATSPSLRNARVETGLIPLHRCCKCSWKYFPMVHPRAAACFMEGYPRWTRGWVSLPGDIGPPSSSSFAIFPLQKP